MQRGIKIDFKRYAPVLLASVFLFGCGSSSDSSNREVKKVSESVANLSDAEKLAYAVAKQGEALSKSEPKSDRTRALDPQSCQNGGTVEIEYKTPQFQVPENIPDLNLSDDLTDINFSDTNFSDANFSDANLPDINFSDQMQDINLSDDMANIPTQIESTITYRNCLEDGGILNGSIKFESTEKSDKMTYLTPFTFVSDEEKITIRPGTVELLREGEWEKLIINVEMTINGITRGGENLVYKGKDLPDGGSIEFPVSGKEKIGDSAYFRVDTTYDASQTPFKTDKRGKLLPGGLFRYVDGQNHRVELEATGIDQITVRVDSDGDGNFSDDEVSLIDIS